MAVKVIAVVSLLTAVTFLLWLPTLARDLVCEEKLRPSDAILVENYDAANYLVFERAGELRRAGFGASLVVPTPVGSDPDKPSPVFAGFVEVLARAAHWPEPPQLIPIREVEPISLNAAYQIRTTLQKERVRSVIVVAPGFRSRRSLLIYSTVFRSAGIVTSCVPVFGRTTTENWMHSWHGIQDVVEQYGKLQYYRFYVLRH
jgi:hypothetical protein